MYLSTFSACCRCDVFNLTPVSVVFPQKTPIILITIVVQHPLNWVGVRYEKVARSKRELMFVFSHSQKNMYPNFKLRMRCSVKKKICNDKTIQRVKVSFCADPMEPFGNLKKMRAERYLLKRKSIKWRFSNEAYSYMS